MVATPTTVALVVLGFNMLPRGLELCLQLIDWLLLTVLISRKFLSASSDPCAMARARSYVKSRSASNFLCMASLFTPHTNLSLSILFNEPP